MDEAEKRKLDAIPAGLGDFESLEDGYLRKVKACADRFGILMEPGLGCICPLSRRWNGKRQGTPAKYLLEVIRVTKAPGAPSAKVFLGYGGDRGGPQPIPAMMEAAVKALKSVRAQAVDAGVKIALENHGHLRAAEARTIIEEAGKDFVGACLDSGNPVRVLEDPLAALGEGSVDLVKFVARRRELRLNAPFPPEIITGGRPSVAP